MPPRRILFDGIPVCSEMMRVASCSADISSEKKPTMPPLTVAIWPSARTSPCPGLGDIVGDVGGERGFAHARPAGKDDQIGGLQAAHPAIEIGQAGRQPGQAAVALIGARRHVDGRGQRLGEALKAEIVTSGLGDFVQSALGVLDVVYRRRVDRRVIGQD